MKHGSRQTQRSSLGSHQNIRISFLKLKKYIYRGEAYKIQYFRESRILKCNSIFFSLPHVFLGQCNTSDVSYYNFFTSYINTYSPYLRLRYKTMLSDHYNNVQ